MSKSTVGLTVTGGASVPIVSETLPGGRHLIQHVSTALRTVLGYGHAAVTTAVSLPNIPAGATHALLTVESGGGDLRWRSDGTSPAAAPSTNANTGLRAPAGSAVEIALVSLADVRVVAVTGTATISVEYSRFDA